MGTGGPRLVERRWIEDLRAEEVRLRCAYQRLGKQVVLFTVQLEVMHKDVWHPAVRYDNAHGFCHRDTLHPDGRQDKTPVFVGDVNATFTHAINDPKANWHAYAENFLREVGA